MGLTQACNILRPEFRPLYLRSFKVRVAPPQLDGFLTNLGINDEIRLMGHFITAAKKGPLPDNGLDVLPFLNSLREKDDVKVYLNSHREMDYWGWGIGTVIDTLSRGYLRRNASHTGILHATFIKHKHPSHNVPNRDVELVLKLDLVFFSLKTGLQKQQEMSSLIYS
jgi:hypothetical protein